MLAFILDRSGRRLSLHPGGRRHEAEKTSGGGSHAASVPTDSMHEAEHVRYDSTELSLGSADRRGDGDPRAGIRPFLSPRQEGRAGGMVAVQCQARVSV